VREVLLLKEKLDLFRNAFVDINDSQKKMNTPQTLALALESAKESIILLKNEKNLLPLDYKRLKRIAVIGPNAATLRTGDYSPDFHNNHRTSILDGIKNLVRFNASVVHSWGCDVSNDMEMVVISSDFLKCTNGKRGFHGRYFNRKGDKSPAFSRRDSEIGISWYLWAPQHQNQEIADADDFYVEWDGFLVPDITVQGYIGIQIDGDNSSAKLFLNDVEVSSSVGDINLEPEVKNLADDGDFFKHWQIDKAIFGPDKTFSSSIRQGSSFIVPYSFVENESLKVRIEYKKIGPKGGIRFVWNLVGPHGINDAKEAATGADVAIVVLGDNDEIMGENRDRQTLNLYGKQGIFHANP
jgi:beta-glucosidase